MGQAEVVVGAGTLRSDAEEAVAFPHRWTPDGVSVEAQFTGGYLLHLSVAGCVLNGVYRESAGLGLQIDGVRVTASGGFDTSAGLRSTGIEYAIDLDSPATEDELARLLAVVDDVAQMPRVIRAGAPVYRTEPAQVHQPAGV